MTYKQLEKIRKEFETLDLSRYRVLTLDEMLKVNGGGSNESDDESTTFDSETLSSDGTSTETVSETGVYSESSGHEIENSNEAVANAEVGDTLTRDDGTQVTITQGDIDWAQNYCNEHGIDWRGEEAKSPEELQSQEDDGSSESTQSVGENVNTDEKNTEINGTDSKNKEQTSNYPAYPDYSEEIAYMNSKLDMPKASNLRETNWDQVKAGAIDILVGLGGMTAGIVIETYSAGVATAPAYVLFSEGITSFCYGIAELGTGFQGGSLPSSTDLFLEQVTFGLAETGFDKQR